jgi:hypothetical protein
MLSQSKNPTMNRSSKSLVDYFRCPGRFAELEVDCAASAIQGFFEFGKGTICFGRCSGFMPSGNISSGLPDSLAGARFDGLRLCMPFDLDEVVDNLRSEKYINNSNGFHEKASEGSMAKLIYYFFRPILPVGIRKYLQRARLAGWEKISFPQWPVDVSVEDVMKGAIGLVAKGVNSAKVPFIWFWPHAAPACAVMTHDVEGTRGRDFCSVLMDMDNAQGIKSSFQIIPEVRYTVSEGFLESIRKRGFEVNVHDLNHDGKLFQEEREFSRRAEKINRYAKSFGAKGFRAGAMYRNQEWISRLSVSYDMSVPNVAHLEPQRGGCCTVMPYFIGGILELPVTMTQDYSLFQILGDFSIDLWKTQAERIINRNGLLSFISHPDYLIEPRARKVYKQLLEYIAQLRDQWKVWVPVPHEIDSWWRSRSQMTLVPDGDSWRIEGPDSDRARVAYATIQEGRVVYTIDGAN